MGRGDRIYVMDHNMPLHRWQGIVSNTLNQ